ncbi:MAG: aspartate carbamoyltransferase catalytic subunit [Nitrospinae bacterium]|nr:aspartate carbamoyltransferase catalytic subunit [Nitrospinota bacterium]
MTFRRKHILGTQGMDASEISYILEMTESFVEVSTREVKKVPTLRGKTIINLFYEPSTRTRTSFEIAGKRLSADVINISTSGSSVVKGESLKDTAMTLSAMAADVIVIRHSASGAPHFLARHVPSSIINGGDGIHEHPTQALLDLFTIRQRKGTLGGLRVSIIGDIAHSRVARSNIFAMRTMGMEVRVCGPASLLPLEVESLGVRAGTDLDASIREADIIMVLRLQLERQEKGLIPSLREYSQLYGLNLKRLEQAKPDVLIMHPGPINRSVEIAPEVAEGPYSLILDQVTNGVALRMALLYLLAGGAGL